MLICCSFLFWHCSNFIRTRLPGCSTWPPTTCDLSCSILPQEFWLSRACWRTRGGCCSSRDLSPFVGHFPHKWDRCHFHEHLSHLCATCHVTALLLFACPAYSAPGHRHFLECQRSGKLSTSYVPLLWDSPVGNEPLLAAWWFPDPTHLPSSTNTVAYCFLPCYCWKLEFSV